MAADEKWYFTKEQLLQSPSRKSGYDVDKELSCRQQAANFIQDMGQRLQVSQLCINTAIVYMHRFYVFHSLAAFHRNAIATAALFLAAKVEEQPRKLEHVIKVAHMCLHRESPNLDIKSELYLEQAQDLVFNENVLLQTLGFDVAIDHPHTHVVRCCHLVRASKDLAQTSYFMASNSLHLTTMCLQYKPTVVACFCIHLACKWSNWEIPRSNEGKDWFWYVDKTVTLDLLEQLTSEFLAIFDKCPTKLKRKMMSMNQNNTPGFSQNTMPQEGLQFDEPRKLSGAEAIKPPEGLFPMQKSTSQSSVDKPVAPAIPPSHGHHQKMDFREYREKKERERLEREKQQQQQQQRENHNSVPSGSHHHSKSNSSSSNSTKPHPNVQSRSSSMTHKSYQLPPHNSSSQNLKENRESSSSSSQSMQQSSNSMKDGNYMKHPPHGDRESNKDGMGFMPQYSQNANISHQNYVHKSDYHSHREGSRSHGQYSGSSNMTQSHHNSNQNSQYLINLNQQKDLQQKEISENPQIKDSMSSNIRDIINQSVAQKDSHSVQNSDRKEQMIQKSRPGYVYGNAPPNFRSDSAKNGREVKNFHEVKHFKKEEDEPVIDVKKLDSIKIEKFEETDIGDETSTWNYDFAAKVKKVKQEPNVNLKEATDYQQVQVKQEPNKNVHSVKYDSKFKTHHYHHSSQVKTGSEKLHRKTHELERPPHSNKPIEKHKVMQPPPQQVQQPQPQQPIIQPVPQQLQPHDQRKEKHSPSKYQKVKTVPRPSSMGLNYIKQEHFNQENSSESTEKVVQPPPKFSIEEANKNMQNLSFQSKPKNHEFGAPGSLASTLPDSNLIKSTKTSSIFSPDSKISPHNILNSLEKDAKKSYRSHTSPVSTKTNVPTTVTLTTTTTTTTTAVTTGSLFSPPLPKTITTPSASIQRHRTSSNSSEPELIPVLTKLEETPGYENIIREKKIALAPNLTSPVPKEVKKPAEEPSKSLFDPDNKEFTGEIKSDLGAVIYPNNRKPKTSFSLAESKLSVTNTASTVNLLGIEKMVDTSITQSSTLKSNLFNVSPKFVFVSNETEKNEKEIIDVEGLGNSDSSKKSEKKKKKEKHKHKEKDKDRSERKKEKKKHKDKDKERSKDKYKDKEKHKDRDRHKEIDVCSPEAPIKITIPKDKINLSTPHDLQGGLKIKISKANTHVISKECPKIEEGGLKIKISKDVIGPYKDESKSSSKKRERSPKSTSDLPHSKHARTEKKSHSSKANGMEGSSRSSSHKHSISGGVKSVEVGRTDSFTKMSQSQSSHQN